MVGSGSYKSECVIHGGGVLKFELGMDVRPKVSTTTL